jgi:hypothetical protein
MTIVMSMTINIVYRMFMTGGRRDQTPETFESILDLREAGWWDPTPTACLLSNCSSRTLSASFPSISPCICQARSSLTQSASQRSSTIVYNQRFSRSDGKLSPNRGELSISMNGLPFCAASKALLKQTSSDTFDKLPLVLRLCALTKRLYFFLISIGFKRRTGRGNLTARQHERTISEIQELHRLSDDL